MELREILPRRRMLRHCAPDPVPSEVVERIVGTVRRAPSAWYSQGQRLLVVTDPKGRAEIARAFGTAGWTAPEGREPWLESAPVHVLVGTREDDYHDRYRLPDKNGPTGGEMEWPVPYWFVDAGAALMLVLIAAIDDGLEAGDPGVPTEVASALHASFAIPEDVALVALVTIGRGAPDPGWSAVTSRCTQPRRATADVVHWERWN